MKALSPSQNAASSDWMAFTTAFGNDHVTRLNLAMAMLMAASFVVFMPAWIMDSRVLDSANVWTKPQKFHVSLSLHFFTIAVLLQLVPRGIRKGPALLIFSYLAAASLILEFVWVGLQAGQAKRSHFANETVIEQIMYGMMGLGAFFLMAIALVLAVQIWRVGERSRHGIWLGAIVGMTLAFISTVYFGYTMSFEGRYVGAPLSGGGEIVPFFGWSREYGDLRPAHFVSLHMMQTIPFSGWLADRYGWNTLAVVGGAAILQIGAAAALFFQAQAGQPFWPA